MNNNSSSNKIKLLENKNFVFLLSLVLAIVLWIFINATAAPESENTISGIAVNIPIENSIAGELGLDIISELETVSVKVMGPAYVVSALDAEDITVTANPSVVTEPGKFTLDLRATKKSTNISNEYEIVSLSPSSVTVSFDYIDTKQFTVIAKANGASAIEGLSAEDAIVANPNNSVISVKGPRKELEKVSKIVAVADVNDVLNKTETFIANIALYDDKGTSLDKKNYLVMDANNQPIDQIEITVPIFKEKEVPVKAQFINAPEEYVFSPISHTLSDNSIIISGQPEMVDSITSISISPINFDSISNENYTFDTNIILPEGIKSTENIETIVVKINQVANYVNKTFDVSNISVVGGATNVSLVRPIRNVKMVGPKSVMKNITASNLYAEVDITGKQAGQHTVVVRIYCKTSKAIWQVGSYTANISIN